MLENHWILNHRVQTLQESPEVTYHRRNLDQVSRVQAMDKAQESLWVAALSELFSHFLICCVLKRDASVRWFI